MVKSLQESFAPNTTCFGCGPKNENGLRIRSFPHGDVCSAEWTPEKHHEAFPGMLNGGIIGSLLDCHCNWTAAWTLMKEGGLSQPPCTVTAEYTIKLLRPTPSDQPVRLVAKAVEVIANERVWIEGELSSGDKITAKCRGLFVAVKEGHPAFHRWS